MDFGRFGKIMVFAFRAPLVRWGAISVAVSGTMLLLVFLLAWRPLSQEREYLLAQIDSKRSSLIDATRRVDRIKDYDETTARIGALEARLNSRLGQADIVNNIHRIAGRYRVRILNDAYKQSRNTAHLVELGQEIVVAAKYEGLRSFLLALDSLPTWTVAVETKMDGSGPEPGEIRAVLRLKTYRTARTGDSGGS